MRGLCGGFAGTRGIDGSGLKSLQGASGEKHQRWASAGRDECESFENPKASKAPKVQTSVIQLVS